MVKISILLLLGVCFRLSAQNVGLTRSIDSSAVEYMRIVGNQSALYYGREQEGHSRVLNHPYLIDEQHANARLSYNQIIYPEALLRLDMNRDELVVLSPDGRNIVLFSEKFDYAYLHDSHIVYLRNNGQPDCPSSGYYTLLHSGSCEVLKKQTATLLRTSTGSRIENSFYFSTNFYLNKDGVYHTIRNRRRFLKIFQPYRNELKRFASSNQLRFRRDTENFIVKTVSEYEKLSNSL